MSEQQRGNTSTLAEAAVRLWPFIALLKGGRVGIENSADAYNVALAMEKACIDYLVEKARKP